MAKVKITKSSIKGKINRKTKPVLLQILPSLHSGGVERGTIEIARAAIEAGFTSMVASEGGPLVQQLETAGIEHMELPLASKNPLVMLWNMFCLSRIIENHQVDIVHARSRAPAWSAYLATKRKKKCHFVTTFHGTYTMSGAIKNWYNSVMVRGDKVIAISKFIEEYINSHYDVPEGRITVIPRGVDVDYFDPKKVPEEEIEAIEKDWKPQKYLPVVMLPARFTRWKGQKFLLEALSHISHHDFTCVMVGKAKMHSTYIEELEILREKYQLRGHVSLHEPTSNMPAAYARADIIISASTEPEAFGRVAIEAQAMEKQVIATNHGGSTETIIDGKTGWLADNNDPKAFGQIIEKVMSLGEKEKNKVGKAARAHVKRKFSTAVMCKRTMDLYRDLLGIKENPSKKPATGEDYEDKADKNEKAA